jgi:hypothetical protein
MFTLISQDTVNFIFLILFPLLVDINFCDPTFKCVLYSVLISLLVVKSLFVEVVLIIWIVLAIECNIVFAHSVTIYFNVFIFSTWCSVITFFKSLLSFIYMRIIWNEIYSFQSDFSPFLMWEVVSFRRVSF